MSMPSIEDEVWTYWTNEVEANCPLPTDKYRVAYKAMMYKCFENPSEVERKHIIEGLLEHYVNSIDNEDLVHLIADALRNKEIDYD